MKKKVLNRFAAFVLLAICLPFTACSQSRILADFPSGAGVEKVYLNKNLVAMGMQNLHNSFDYGGSVSGSIQGIEVYNCNNAELAASVKDKIDQVVKKYNAQIMIEAEDGNQTSIICNLYNEKEQTMPIGMAIIEYEGKEINVVILHGAYFE